MEEKFDIAVIGAGSGGLTVAAGAAQLGLKTVLFEAGEMGGDCLNLGCVPSKSLIAAAERMHMARTAAPFGITASAEADFAKVMAHVHGVIADIAPHDSQERFEGFGVEVVRARARLTGSRTIAAGNRGYRAKRIVIATGSRPLVPDIPGLSATPHLTNETVWGLKERPAHLVILGGGNIGVEMAQAFRRLGSKVSIVEQDRLMGRDDAELVEILRGQLAREGIAIYENASATAVSPNEAGVEVTLGRGDVISGSHLLVAVGRQPNVEDLGLDAAGVKLGRRAIHVDARLRTSNRRIFAVGDCREGPQFTHAAGYDGGIVIRNALFRMRAKADYSAMPWCTFTDPELAQVGLTEADARRTLKGVEVFSAPFSGNDRAQAERRTTGKLKLVLSKGKLVGASMCGPHAGELIHPLAFALSKGLGTRDLTGYIAPYPTLGEINKAAANSVFTEKLFSPAVRALVKGLSKLP